MKQILYFIVSGPVTIYVLWLYYLAVMTLKRANDKRELTGFVRAVAYTVKYTGLALDMYCNLLWMTVLFHELPQEWLVTDRVSRLKKKGDKIAIWMCEKLLDPFDEPCHCK